MPVNPINFEALDTPRQDTVDRDFDKVLSSIQAQLGLFSSIYDKSLMTLRGEIRMRCYSFLY
jgi:hypothetical protein